MTFLQIDALEVAARTAGLNSVGLPTVALFNQVVQNQGPAGALQMFENLMNVGPVATGPNFAAYGGDITAIGPGTPDTYHEYLVSGDTGYASAQAAFAADLGAPGGETTPSNISPTNPVQSGQVTTLLGNNPIVTYVDTNDMTIFNVTIPNHIFAPGLVMRYVQQGSNGLYYINLYGEGNGAFPLVNVGAAGSIFGGTTTILH